MAITTIISNPMRALQLENQRLRTENEALRRQLTAERAGRALGQQVSRADIQAPLPATTTRLDEGSARAAARALPARPAPRAMIHLVAAESVAPRPVPPDEALRSTVRTLSAETAVPRPETPRGPSSPRVIDTEARVVSPSSPRPDEPNALDDAALRFRLLELD